MSSTAYPVIISAPMPVQDRLVKVRRKNFEVQQDPLEGLLEDSWAKYFTRLEQTVALTPTRLVITTLEDQSASIAATAFTLPALSSGMYRVSIFATVVQAATTSSSLIVTLAFTYGGQSKTISTSAMTGNALTTVLSDAISFLVDASSPVTYATTYASVGATAMEYDLSMAVEALPQ